MSENPDTYGEVDLKAAELENMKGTADRLGISYHPSIGAEKLNEKIKAKLAEDEPAAATEEATVATTEETTGERNRRLRQEALSLVRVRVSCMNPTKKDIEGEIFTTGNSVLGTVKKYVPFNTEEGWHVPQIILNMLQSRKCQVFVTERTANGGKAKRGKLINEFSVEILDPLTEAELHELGQRQAMAGGV